MIFISMKSEGKNTEMDKKDLKSLTFDELKMEIEGRGEKPFRAKQLLMHPLIQLLCTDRKSVV